MQRNERFESIRACEKLKIDRAIFTSLPDFADRSKVVIYYYIKNEIDNIAHIIASADVYTEQLAKVYEETSRIRDEAFQYLLSSSDLNESTQHSYYGPYSLGLREMYLDCMPVKIGEKQAGIEPGMMAIDPMDVFIRLYTEMPDPEKRRQFILTLLYKNKSKLEKLCHSIHKKEKKIEKITKAIVRVMATYYERYLPSYLIKLTFKEIKEDKVTPGKDDIARSSTVQKYTQFGGKFFKPIFAEITTRAVQHAKQCTFEEKNFEATLEVLTNDLAALLGLKTQKQVLCKAYYKNNLLKLLLKGQWVTDAQTLQLGGNRREGVLQPYGNFCVRPVQCHRANIEAIADDSMSIARYYIFFILFGDYDTIGSKGQNKLFIPADDPHAQRRDLVGIDFGHSFVEKIKIVNKLNKRDFSFIDPKKKFKNFDVFRDAPRSEYMYGVLKLAKLAGKTISPAVIESYGKTFQEEYEALQVGDDEKLFKDYHQMFCRLEKSFEATESGNKNRHCCRFIVEKILETRAKEIDSRNTIVEYYSHYLQLTRFEVDLLENIQKLFAGPKHTSLRSIDGTVLLNHLRIASDESSLETLLQIGSIRITETATHRQFYFTFAHAAEAYKGILILKSWRKSEYYLGIKQIDNEILLEYPKDRIQDIYALFNENKIKRCFHPKDYALYAHYKREEKLDFLLKELGLIFHETLSCTRHAEDKYTINFSQSELLSLLESKFSEMGVPVKDRSIEFNINNFVRVLEIFEECYAEQHVDEMVKLKFYLAKILSSYSANRRNSWTPNLNFEEMPDQLESPRTSTSLKSIFTTYIDPRMQLSNGVLAHLQKELDNIKKHPQVDNTAIQMAKEMIEKLLRCDNRAVSTSSPPLRFRATTC